MTPRRDGNRAAGAVREAMDGIVFALPPEVIDRIADAVVERVLERLEQAPEGRWLRGAARIAEYLDAPVSRIYSLASLGRLPVHRDGSALVARTDELDAWVHSGGGIRA